MQLEFADMWYLAPELTMVIFAFALIILDLFLPKKVDRIHWFGGLTLLGLAVSAVFVIIYMTMYNPDSMLTIQAEHTILNGTYRVDDFANLMKLVFLIGTSLVVLLSMGSLKNSDIKHRAEYYYLMLPAVLGAMVMVSSADMITLYIGLELLSITSYVLVAMRKNNTQSGESAFKYLVLGGIASAFILYGMSFLYGITGATHLNDVRAVLFNEFDPSMSGLMYVSLFLLLAGFGFKISAAPFHAWTPDVYQGAPTPITAFLAVVSKAAGIAFLFRIFFNVFYGVGNADTPIYSDMFLALTVLAATAMIIGNALALKQRNLKRLLAYSGIANAGYLLVPISLQIGAVHFANFSEMYFYLLAYLFMNIGAFAVVLAVSRVVGHEELNGFAGLYYRAPWLAITTTILLLSLAGLPITGGFIGKFYIMLGAVSMHEYWLAAVMIITSVVSFYYYFGWIAQMYMRSNAPAERLRVPWPISTVIWITTIATVLMGIFPSYVFDYIDHVFSIYKDLFTF